MATHVHRRWGIVAIAVGLILLNLLSNALLGNSGGLYIVFWGYIAYLAYKGDVGNIFQWVKWVLIINVVGGLGFAVFADDDMMRWIGFGSVDEFLIALGIPVAIKGGLLLYLNGQLASSETKSDSYPVVNRSVSAPTGRDVAAVSIDTPQKRVEILKSAHAGVIQVQSLTLDRPAHQEPTVPRTDHIDEEKQVMAVELSADDEERAYETAGEEVDTGTYRKGVELHPKLTHLAG